MTTGTQIYTASDGDARFWQGEILSGVVETWADFGAGDESVKPIARKVLHKFAIIMTPDCDLERAHGESNDSRTIERILFLVAYDDIPRFKEDQEINSRIWERISKNNDERYQYLRGLGREGDLQDQGFKDLCADFRQFFTVRTSVVVKATVAGSIQRRCRLTDRYAIHLATRFFQYQSRIGLPEPHYLRNPQ